MKKIKIQSILKWFTWHLIPTKEEAPVKSIIETGLYIALFFLCWYLFINWSDVPVRTDSIHIECLASPDSKKYDIAPIAQVTYCIPMTSTDRSPEDITNIHRLSVWPDTTKQFYLDNKDSYYLYVMNEKVKPGLTISFSQWTTKHYKDNTTDILFNENYKSPLLTQEEIEELNDSVRIKEINKTQFWKSSFSLPGYPYETEISYMIDKNDKYWKDASYSNIMNNRYLLGKKEIEERILDRRDSLYKAFIYKEVPNAKNTYRKIQEMIKNNEYSDEIIHPLYYANINSSYSHYKKLYGCQNDSSEYFENNYLILQKLYDTDNRQKIYEAYISGKTDRKQLYLDKALYDNIKNYSGWFRLEDISQAYYNINLESFFIDSIRLKFDFVGATNFSLMDPEPDKVTMSSIEFTDPQKILQIKLYGLKFHAQFIELENKQQIRMFIVTALLSGMIMILVALLFSGFFKFILYCKEKY